MPACRRDTTTRRAARTRAAAPLLAAILSLAAALPTRAATPPGGSLSPTNTSVTWTGTVSGGPGGGEATCVNGVTCDSFRVELEPGDYTGTQLEVQVTWTVPAYD